MLSDTGELAITIRRAPSEVVVAVDGDVDAFTAPRLRAALSSIAEPVDVAIDATGLTFIDSGGLSVLVGAAKQLADRGRFLVLRNAKASILRVLEITSVDTIVRVEMPEPAGGALHGRAAS